MHFILIYLQCNNCVEHKLKINKMKKNNENYDSSLRNWIHYFSSDKSAESPQDTWLTIPEICTLLRCSEPTVYRKIYGGQLKYSKPSCIMIWMSDVAQYVIAQTKLTSRV